MTGTILDLGCGDGKLTSILLGSLVNNLIPITILKAVFCTQIYMGASNMVFEDLFGINLVGIDSDADETSQAARLGIYHRVHTCLASNIPEDSDSFDAVISNSVLEHIENIEETIKEVSRLLKNGGRFIFTVPGPDFHACLYGPLTRHASRQAYLDEIDKRLVHYRYWDLQQWQECLGRYGMRVTAREEYLRCVEVRRWEMISRFTAGIFYMVSGRKKTPFQIQKTWGMRQLQNRFSLPRWAAWPIAKILSAGISEKDEKYGCLLVDARKES
jgi:SAM-dependent methyltransferase